jgi:hypothetical protein
MALQFEAKKVALKQDRNGYILTLLLHPDEVPVELLRDFVGARYGCAFVRINDDESQLVYVNRVQKAAILCKTPAFMDYMGAITEEMAARKLCEACEITSRSELNGNLEAQQKFDELLMGFQNANPF